MFKHVTQHNVCTNHHSCVHTPTRYTKPGQSLDSRTTKEKGHSYAFMKRQMFSVYDTSHAHQASFKAFNEMYMSACLRWSQQSLPLLFALDKAVNIKSVMTSTMFLAALKLPVVRKISQHIQHLSNSV